MSVIGVTKLLPVPFSQLLCFYSACEFIIRIEKDSRKRRDPLSEDTVFFFIYNYRSLYTGKVRKLFYFYFHFFAINSLLFRALKVILSS